MVIVMASEATPGAPTYMLNAPDIALVSTLVMLWLTPDPEV